MLAAKGKGDAPPELAVMAQSRRLSIPLQAGGLYDYDYALLLRLELLESAYHAVNAWRDVRRKMNPAESKMIDWLATIGVM